MEKFILANGCATRVSDTQKGDKVVVLLHGYLESLDIWEKLTAILAKEYRVVSLDLPGHGISEVKGEVHTMEFVADAVADAMKQLGVASGCIVGHSMGGYVALSFAERHPEMVDSFVLLHSSPNADTEIKAKNRLREIELILRGKKELLAKIAPQERFAAQNRCKFANSISDIEEQIDMTDDDGIVALLRGMGERKDHNATLAKLGKPTMLVFGRHDDYIPVAAAESIILAQSQAKAVWMENSGHMSLIEEPEELANVLSTII